MSLLKFELKKMVKQKKYIWLLVAIFLITTALFMVNSYQRSRLQGRWAMYSVLAEQEKLGSEWEYRETQLILLRDRGMLDDSQEEQLKYSSQMGQALNVMRINMRFEQWQDLATHEQRFLENLEKYKEAGGEFTALEGIDLEITKARNEWIRENGLSYEFESFPLTPHLFLKGSSAILLGIIGIMILLMFCGNSITEEKENSTWNTLNTQPISKTKLIVSKYMVFLLMSLLYIGIFVGIGIAIPYLKGAKSLIFNYPQTMIAGETFRLISTGTYLVRAMVLFICASSVTYSMSLLASKWVKKAFSSYVLVGIVLSIGYFATANIQTPLSPFYLLNFGSVLSKIPATTDWIYLLSAGLWTSIFLGITAILPDQEIKAVQEIEKQVVQWINNKNPFAGGKTNPKGKLVWNMSIFELRKIRRESLLKIFAAAIIVLVFAGYFFVSLLTEQQKQAYFQELDWRAELVETRIVAYKIMLEETKETIKAMEEAGPDNYVPDYDEEYYGPGYEQFEFDYHYVLHYLKESIGYGEEYLKEIEKEVQLFEDAKKSLENGVGTAFYEYQRHVNEQYLGGILPSGDYFSFWNSPIGFTEEVSLAHKQYLIDNNIQPILTGEFIPNMHLFWRGDRTRYGWENEQIRQTEWEQQNKTIDNSGLFFLHLSVTNYAYYIPLVLLLFFIGGGLAKEKGKKMTYNLLKTQPISDQNIFMGKVINSMLIILACAIILPVFLVVVGTVVKGFGDWNFPILRLRAFRETLLPGYTGLKAGHGAGYEFISIGKYLMNSTVLFMALGMFITAISLSLSLIFKRTLSVLASTTIICVGGYWLNTRKRLLVNYKSPFTYFDIPKVVNGEFAARLNNPKFSLQTGLIVLLGMTLLLLVASYVFINREKVWKLAVTTWKGFQNRRREKNDSIS